MIKVGKLWGDAKFASLSPLSKLLYCYLISQPNITTLGVLDISIERIQLDLNTRSLGAAFRELKLHKYIKWIPVDKNIGKRALVIVVDHYHSLPKSKLNIRKAIDEGKTSSKDLITVFHDIFTGADFNNDTYKPPTPAEVMEYGLSLGYLVDGKQFVKYYADNDWYDKNNKKVRAWKSKVVNIWCREERKLQTASGAPKGFEYFFIDIEDGVRIFPESWKNGLPSHRNYIYAELLINEYNERS